MGGGGAMRTAAKVAGVGVYAGVRGGISSVPQPAEHSVRSASRPAVSAVVSSSQGGGVGAAVVQRPAWEVDDWEFAGGEEELFVEPAEPIPRVVFGAAPTREEAKAATNDLKDAIEKVFLSSPAHAETGGTFGVNQLSSLSLITKSDYLDTKSCITCDPNAAPLPTYAVKAFSLLNESPAVQSVVASIASDPKVWEAVLQNEALTEFLESHKTNTEFPDQESPRKFTDIEPEDLGSPRNTERSEAGDFDTEPIDFLGNIRLKVIEMVSNVSSFMQNIFNFASGGNNSAAADGNAKPPFVDKTLGASFMALAVMVIMVVVMKRA